MTAPTAPVTWRRSIPANSGSIAATSSISGVLGDGLRRRSGPSARRLRTPRHAELRSPASTDALTSA